MRNKETEKKRLRLYSRKPEVKEMAKNIEKLIKKK